MGRDWDMSRSGIKGMTAEVISLEKSAFHRFSGSVLLRYLV